MLGTIPWQTGHGSVMSVGRRWVCVHCVSMGRLVGVSNPPTLTLTPLAWLAHAIRPDYNESFMVVISAASLALTFPHTNKPCEVHGCMGDRHSCKRLPMQTTCLDTVVILIAWLILWFWFCCPLNIIVFPCRNFCSKQLTEIKKSIKPPFKLIVIDFLMTDTGILIIVLERQSTERNVNAIWLGLHDAYCVYRKKNINL